jgi:predicted nucleotide-binding protein
MSEQLEISPGDRRLLGRVLRSSVDGAGIVASVFRARNAQFLERLNALEADGFLRRDNDRYYLTLVALSELSSPSARSILRDANRVFRHLVKAYQESQSRPVLAQALADNLGLTLDRTLLVLRYMVEGPWAGGYANLSKTSDVTPYVVPSEQVLQLKTFTAVVDRMRQWHVQRMRSASRWPGFIDAETLEQQLGVAATRSLALAATDRNTNSMPSEGTQEMARTQNQNTPARPELTESLQEAQKLLKIQIERGEAAPNLSINESDDARRWYNYTSEMLRQICTTDELTDDFTGKGRFSFGDDISTGHYLKKLRSIYDRLELLPISGNVLTSTGRTRSGASSKRVFVVHGHDEGLKEGIARFLQKLHLQPVILHEQPNKGRTIIEKFEDHSDVAFAVILFTPDDIGYPAADPAAAKPRARQNVLLELGFFMHAIGRDKVCVLYTPGVELPSDYAGVLYLELDKAGAWHVQLAREMKAAGLPIDMNDVF